MFKAMQSVLKGTPSNIYKIQPFIFCRYLGGSSSSLFVANLLNRYYNIPIKNQCLIVQEAFKNARVPYIKYISQSKSDISNDIEIIQEYFNVNAVKAKEYLDLISDKELHDIKIAFLRKG